MTKYKHSMSFDCSVNKHLCIILFTKNLIALDILLSLDTYLMLRSQNDKKRNLTMQL